LASAGVISQLHSYQTDALASAGVISQLHSYQTSEVNFTICRELTNANFLSLSLTASLVC